MKTDMNTLQKRIEEKALKQIKLDLENAKRNIPTIFKFITFKDLLGIDFDKGHTVYNILTSGWYDHLIEEKALLSYANGETDNLLRIIDETKDRVESLEYYTANLINQ